MAAITHLLATSTTANAGLYSTNTFTPAASSLLFAFVAASGTTATAPFLEISTQSWKRFTLVTTAPWGGGANLLYAFISNGPVSSASALKAFFDCSQDNATACVIQIAEITGMSRTGLSAIRQIAAVDSEGATSTTPVCTWTVSTLTANACIAGVGYTSSIAQVTPMTNWTERSDVGVVTPSTACEYMSRDSGNVSTTVSTEANVNSGHAMIAVELNTSTIDTPMGTNLQYYPY
jgi:hypothetical protein